MNIHNKAELANFINATQRALEEAAARIDNSMDTRPSTPELAAAQSHDIFYSIKLWPAHFNQYGECKRIASVTRTTKIIEQI